ncbi:PKD domain-containing protein [Mucilaginibacter dorajii]|uniref:PKD domain-containing protein n=1 Tax=Mucilaginibacter dorajii TaxID=692994 RepID=A0ABP7PGH9_9SPHI|nr:PKD domain-containing protein [Mucilaginibacter dorajii]MCS3735448.1 hypothetical protein [Mucilaginibacter dorajii]
MKLKIKLIAMFFIAAVITYSSCTKTKYSFGEIKTPSDLKLTTTITGVDAADPAGSGAGTVAITVSAINAITYNIDFGDGNKQIVSSGVITYKYNNPGTFDYTITVNAVGTGGATSTISKKITVFVAYTIPPAIVEGLTGGSSRTWVTDREAPGHVGVGPTNTFTPDYYAATPNQRADCLYDDEITFTKDANGNILMSVNNKGQSFVIAASTAYYGKAGGDNCYDIDESGSKKLVFMDATSGSNSGNSTMVQFMVPGNGLINFGTGANTYEILSISDTNISLRNIGIDGLAWYQKLKVK